MTRAISMLVCALALLAAACGAASAGPTGPPGISYGRDICIECGMSIDDVRFAAAYRLDDGTEKGFDDVGGLVVHDRKFGGLAGATVWVHDFETEHWILAVEAYFLPTRGVASPMGHGILAFADEGRATRAAADLGSDVIRWDVVQQLPIIDGRVGHHHAEDANMTDNKEGAQP